MSIETSHWEKCPGHESIVYEATDLNQHISDQLFRYSRCDQCGLIRLVNPPESIGEYYPSTYHDFPDLQEIESIANKTRCKIDTVLKFVNSGRLVEIGPSYGLFCYQAKKAGFDVQAIEMNERCCDFLRNTIGIDAIQSDEPAKDLAALQKHDVIALWHVIEHLPDPWSMIRAAAENLNENGILIMAAPNPESWQFEKMAEKWPHLDAPRHMYLLPARLLEDFCASVGLRCEYVTTTDAEAKGWNRFGWQRWLMNRVSGRFMQGMAYVTGYVISAALSLFDGREPRGSAYTIVFRKV